MSIGNRLRIWRNSNGWTQERIATLLSVHVGMIRKWEGEVSLPGSEALQRIGSTGVNLHWLLTGKGSMNAATMENTPQKSLSNLKDLPHLQRYEKRLGAILTLMEDMENEQERDALISEIFARVSTAKQIDELKHLVAKLTANQAKTG